MMEQLFLNSVQWISDNRMWIMPIVAGITLAMLVCAGSVLVGDARETIREWRKS
jgi:hypothetical protein